MAAAAAALRAGTAWPWRLSLDNISWRMARAQTCGVINIIGSAVARMVAKYLWHRSNGESRLVTRGENQSA